MIMMLMIIMIVVIGMILMLMCAPTAEHFLFFILDSTPYLIFYLVNGARSLSAPLTKKVIAKDCATVQTVKDR